jgi:hypothetical protein
MRKALTVTVAYLISLHRGGEGTVLIADRTVQFKLEHY